MQVRACRESTFHFTSISMKLNRSICNRVSLLFIIIHPGQKVKTIKNRLYTMIQLTHQTWVTKPYRHLQKQKSRRIRLTMNLTILPNMTRWMLSTNTRIMLNTIMWNLHRRMSRWKRLFLTLTRTTKHTQLCRPVGVEKRCTRRKLRGFHESSK